MINGLAIKYQRTGRARVYELKYLYVPHTQLKEYKVIGRRVPTDKDPEPNVYRMAIFAPDAVTAKSRFWYFMKKLKKLKKTTGEICYCGQVQIYCIYCLNCTSLPCTDLTV